MNKLLLFLFILFLNNLLSIGQEDSTKQDNIIKLNHIILPNISLTDKQYIDNTIIGFRFSGNTCGSALSYCSYRSLSFNQILPNKKNINDSLSTILTGYFISYLDGINLLNKNKKIDLAIMLGFEFGRLRLYGNPLLRKKNGHFAPKIEIQPKIKLKRLVIGGTIGYGYDISNPNWKDTWFSKDKSYTLNKLKQSGFSWQVFLGWSMYK